MMSEPIVRQLCKWRNRETNFKKFEDEFYEIFITPHISCLCCWFTTIAKDPWLTWSLFWGGGGGEGLDPIGNII